MVWCGGLVQTDMGLNQNQRLFVPLTVWDIDERGFDGADQVFQMVVVHLLGVRKIVEDQMCSLFCMKLVGMIFGPRFQWIPIGYRWSLYH